MKERPRSAAPTRDQPKGMAYASGLQPPSSEGSRPSSESVVARQVEDGEAAFKKKLFEHYHTVLDAFRKFDENHDGSVSKKELKKFLNNMNLPLDDTVFDTVVAHIDDDCNGEVGASRAVLPTASDAFRLARLIIMNSCGISARILQGRMWEASVMISTSIRRS